MLSQIRDREYRRGDNCFGKRRCLAEANFQNQNVRSGPRRTAEAGRPTSRSACGPAAHIKEKGTTGPDQGQDGARNAPN